MSPYLFINFICFLLLFVCKVEEDAQMLSMMLQESHRRNIHVEPRSMAIAKRGVCTFVQKASALERAGADFALIVNNGMLREMQIRVCCGAVVFVSPVGCYIPSIF